MSGLEDSATDLMRGVSVELGRGLVLPEHGFVWLRVRRR